MRFCLRWKKNALALIVEDRKHKSNLKTTWKWLVVFDGLLVVWKNQCSNNLSGFFNCNVVADITRPGMFSSILGSDFLSSIVFDEDSLSCLSSFETWKAFSWHSRLPRFHFWERLATWKYAKRYIRFIREWYFVCTCDDKGNKRKYIKHHHEYYWISNKLTWLAVLLSKIEHKLHPGMKFGNR